MIKITNPPPLPPPIRLIFLSYDLNSSSSKVHFRRILQEKTEHNKERKWKFKTTVETDNPNNIRRQRRGVTYHHALCETLEPWKNRPQCAGQSASARARFKAFWTQACERARISGGKQRTESADGKKRRRRRIDWLYTYSYISRVYILLNTFFLNFCLLCFVVPIFLRGECYLFFKINF